MLYLIQILWEASVLFQVFPYHLNMNGILSCKSNTQRTLTPRDLNWVQHWVSRIGLSTRDLLSWKDHVPSKAETWQQFFSVLTVKSRGNGTSLRLIQGMTLSLHGKDNSLRPRTLCRHKSRVPDRQGYRELSQGDCTVESHPENSCYPLSKVNRGSDVWPSHQLNLSLLVSDIGQ